MIVSGSLILLFIFFHLAHFTLVWIDPSSAHLEDTEGRNDFYAMLAARFSRWPIVWIYIVGMAVIFSHLSHAMFSVLQTLGRGIGGMESSIKLSAKLLALVIVMGFVAIPLSFLFNLIGAA